MDFSLTGEQQEIVNHTFGPALVFAVAGSGKTTSMVRRIERLIKNDIVAPEKLLATSYNKDAVLEIKKKI